MSILPGLNEAGLLKKFVTTFAFTSGTRQNLRSLPGGELLQGILARRLLPSFLDDKTDAIWGHELFRATSSRLCGPIITHKLWKWTSASFDSVVEQRYAGQYQCIYGVEDTSAKTFFTQKKMGGLCALRQVTPHMKAYLAELRSELSKHKSELTPYQELTLREEKESLALKEASYRLADIIICNSAFVRETFIQNGFDTSRVVVVPTGCPDIDKEGGRAGRGADTLRFLFVGNLTVRKGFHYLIEAWRSARLHSKATLWIVGRTDPDTDSAVAGLPGVRLFGHLTKEALEDVYRKVDVLVFPTLLEGLAHVILEALAFGLPIITTPEAGAGDLVRDGWNGFLLKRANGPSVQSAMQWCVNNSTRLGIMGERSRQQARLWSVAASNRAHLCVMQELLDSGERRMNVRHNSHVQ